MRKRIVAMIVCLLFCALVVCHLLNFEDAQTHQMVTLYANILRDAEEVKSAFRNSGVQHYGIFAGRHFMHHYIEIAVDRPVQNRRHLERICVEYLKANVESYQMDHCHDNC